MELFPRSEVKFYDSSEVSFRQMRAKEQNQGPLGTPPFFFFPGKKRADDKK